MDENLIRNRLEEAIKVQGDVLSDEAILKTLSEVAQSIIGAYNNGNKVLFCGNGGSAADAQHLAAELSGRYYLDREPLNAEALHVNTSYLTATANDYSFDEVYSRLVRAKGNKGDILVGISTSGNSVNVVKAMQVAIEKGIVTIGLTGSKESAMDEYCHLLLKVPSNDTPRIQESQMLMGHIICEMVEKEIFG